MTIELALVSYQSHWRYSLTDPLAADSHQDFDKVHELTQRLDLIHQHSGLLAEKKERF